MNNKEYLVNLNHPERHKEATKWCIDYCEVNNNKADWFTIGNVDVTGENYTTCSFVFYDPDLAFQFKLMGF
jgi:hypothetical protein